MIMGDLPWATAWYGDHLCVWLSLNLSDPRHQNDFFAINDLHRPVRALQMSRETLDKPMMMGLDMNPDRASWERLAFGLVQARYDIRQLVGSGGLESDIPYAVRQRAAERWKQALQELAPDDFTLRYSPLSYLEAGHLFLTDRPRWSEPGR